MDSPQYGMYSYAVYSDNGIVSAPSGQRRFLLHVHFISYMMYSFCCPQVIAYIIDGPLIVAWAAEQLLQIELLPHLFCAWMTIGVPFVDYRFICSLSAHFKHTFLQKKLINC